MLSAAQPLQPGQTCLLCAAEKARAPHLRGCTEPLHFLLSYFASIIGRVSLPLLCLLNWTVCCCMQRPISLLNLMSLVNLDSWHLRRAS